MHLTPKFITKIHFNNELRTDIKLETPWYHFFFIFFFWGGGGGGLYNRFYTVKWAYCNTKPLHVLYERKCYSDSTMSGQNRLCVTTFGIQ